MGERRAFNLYLIHLESGRCFSLSEVTRVGRQNAEISFPHDEQVSGGHCQIVRTPQGYAIHDTGSANGTEVDGAVLVAHKLYLLREGATIRVGRQNLLVQESATTVAEPPFVARGRMPLPAPLPPPRRPRVFPVKTLLVGALALGAFQYFRTPAIERSAKKVAPPPKLVSPLETVERQFQRVLAHHDMLILAQSGKNQPRAEYQREVREKILPELKRLQAELDVVKGGSEWESRKLELNRKLARNYVQLMEIVIQARKKQEPALAKRVQRINSEISGYLREVRQLERQRKPAGFNY